MNKSVLIVERPGEFRDGLLREVSQRGAETHVRDDAMEALASLEQLRPDVVLVSEDPGPPGSVSLCRLLRRKLREAAVFRLGEPSLADGLDERSQLLPRAVGAQLIANVLLGVQSPANATWSAQRAWQGTLGSLELGPLLMAIGSRWLTGRLSLTRPGAEREIWFVRGLPVHARSSVLSERLGAVGLRRGLFDESQLEQALDLAHTRSLRLGEALLELDVLDPPRLFRALSAQLIEQLTAACNSGSCAGRFVLDQEIALRGTLLRLSPLTALVHSASQTPSEDNERVLEELADRALACDSLPSLLGDWLRDLQLPDATRLRKEATSVRALRALLGDALRDRQDLPPGGSDAVTLALLRSGGISMPGRHSMVPADLRAGIRTLSPPSIASAIVRCARSSFEDWPVTALAQARTTIEQGIDAYLHGQRPAEVARALALSGPEADLDPADAEIYGLYLRASGGRFPFAGLLGTPAGTVPELRLRCHELLQRLEALQVQHGASIARAHLVLTRAHIERTLSLLPSLPEPAPPPPRVVEVPKPPEPRPEPPAQVSIRPSVNPQGARSQTLPRPLDPKLLAAVEPLLSQGRWGELRSLLATENADPRQLSPALALLYAIAQKEDDAPHVSQEARPQAETLAIRAMSQLLAVPEQSAMAVVIGKRALRRRPLDWNQKPPGRVSLLLVVAALVVGALVGLLFHHSLIHLLWK